MIDVMSNIHEVATVLARGDAAIFPTDTVYGVGVAVEYAPTPAILFDLKRRSSDKPVAWLVASHSDVARYGRNIQPYVEVLIRAFWPGALTVIVQASAAVPSAYQSREGTIGLRMPASEQVRHLASLVQSPLATTSANYAGCGAPATINDLDPSFAHAVGCVLAGTEYQSGTASTVVDCTGPIPAMVRVGSITQHDIDKVLVS